MKFFLRDGRNNLYFRCANFWTSNPEAAFDFGQSRNLLDFVDRQNLHHMQVVVKSENPRYCEIVPLESVRAPI